MSILLKGGRLVDPGTGLDAHLDLLMEGSKILQVGSNLTVPGAEVVDCLGKVVFPGLVDMHVHLRDPGQTQKEDMDSGTRAAAAGGVTTLVAMPNTSPIIDNPEIYAEVQKTIHASAHVHVIQAGSMTKGELGKELSDIEGMAKAGVRVLSEDGKSVMDAGLCKKAFLEAAKYDLLVCDHCEDISLRGDGCMHEDENAKRLGLPGIPSSCEDVITFRDIALAAEAGARLHLCHMSTEGAYLALKAARERGLSVTGEVCPHHFLLSTDDIPGDDPLFKMNPPLRGKKDVEAMIQGLKEGVITVISTDHAPHTKEDKAGSMRKAAFGIVGIETSFALSYTYLVKKGVLTLFELLEKMCTNPARILGLPSPALTEGSVADVVVADLDKEWVIAPEKFLSKGKNTPFGGYKVFGKVERTYVGGELVYQDEA